MAVTALILAEILQCNFVSTKTMYKTNISSDPVYPDPYSGGYKGPKNCGGFAATSVISVSWGQNEGGMPLSYMVRQCNE